jgi:hypothetical protein
MKYGIPLGSNSPNNKMTFTLQRRTVRIIAGVKFKNSCRNLFIRLEILPFPCEYIFTLMNLVLNKREHFQTQQHTVLRLRTETIFTDQLPNFRVLKKVRTVLASKSSTVTQRELCCPHEEANVLDTEGSSFFLQNYVTYRY